MNYYQHKTETIRGALLKAASFAAEHNAAPSGALVAACYKEDRGGGVSGEAYTAAQAYAARYMGDGLNDPRLAMHRLVELAMRIDPALPVRRGGVS